MIISVIGAQNTGKSTFIKDFIREFPHFTTSTIDYRSQISKLNLKINQEGDYESQQAIMDFLIDDIITQSMSGKDVIVDRSVIDCYVYTSWLYKYRNNIQYLNLRRMFIQIHSYFALYDMFLYFPLYATPNMVIEKDGFRDTDPEFRRQIDVEFDNVIQYSLPTDTFMKVHPIGGTRDERIHKVRHLVPVPACV